MAVAGGSGGLETRDFVWICNFFRVLFDTGAGDNSSGSGGGVGGGAALQLQGPARARPGNAMSGESRQNSSGFARAQPRLERIERKEEIYSLPSYDAAAVANTRTHVYTCEEVRKCFIQCFYSTRCVFKTCGVVC